MIFENDKKGKRAEYNVICSYLLQLQKERPQEFKTLTTFSCYEEEAKDNLYALLDEFGGYYSKQRVGLFSAPYYGFRELHQKLVCDFFGDDYDLRFPIGKRYYFCYAHKSGSAEILIDTDEVESLHGTLEYFIIFFKTGMVLKGNRGSISVYIDK